MPLTPPLPSTTKCSSLARPWCRIPIGEAGTDDAFWRDVLALPAVAMLGDWKAAGFDLPDTQVKALAGCDAMMLRFECDLRDVNHIIPRDNIEPMARGEHVWFELSPRNDVRDWFRFAGNFAGQREATRSLSVTGECSLDAMPDTWTTSKPAGFTTYDWRCYHGITPKHWWMEFLVPWRLLGLDGRPAVMGLSYGRNIAVMPQAEWAASVAWPVNIMETRGPRQLLAGGEALLTDALTQPPRIELPPLRFGENEARIASFNRKDAVVTVAASRAGASAADIPAGDGESKITFCLDRAAGSHLEPFDAPAIRFELRSKSGDPLYNLTLPGDRHIGLTIDEPYGGEEVCGNVTTRRDAMLRRICAALPRLRRANTNQAAPSDFCLVDEEGHTVVNLMADDAWDRFAAIIESRFDTTEDRLAAAMALIGQKSVTNLYLQHMLQSASGEQFYHSTVQELMSPLSIVRYGGGPAAARAAVLARLLQQVEDPATGRPFVTRLVFFGLNGGPRQTTRGYAGAGSLSPFVQHPGGAGAVAVDYHGEQTLLDPTGLCIFIEPDGTLASIQRVFVDEALRADGAGRMSLIYAKLDLDEILHQRPDERMGKGVFPELALSGDGDDRPQDPRDRQTPMAIVAPRGQWSGRASLASGTVRSGDVRVKWDDKQLHVEVRVRGIDTAALTDRDRSIERVSVLVDAEHVHRTYHRFAATLGGERRATREYHSVIQRVLRHLSTEASWEDRVVDCDWSATFDVVADGYTLTMRTPWSAMDGDAPAAAFGLNVVIDGRYPHYEQAQLALPRFRHPTDAFAFADVYRGSAPVTLAEIDFGISTWGDNVGRAVLVNRTDRAVTVALSSQTELTSRRGTHARGPSRVEVPAGGRAEADFAFHIDPTEKWGASGGQIVHLAAHVGDEIVYAGSWRANFDTFISAFPRYGEDVEPCGDPSATDPDFAQKKVRYICSRLPKLRRLTTRDGAASDFILLTEDGSVTFNLMQEGVLARIGRYVASLFDNDLDRVLGMMMFAHNPAIARHQSVGHRFMDGADGLSVIRGMFSGAGGNCAYNSRIFATLASRLPLDQGMAESFTCGVRAHTVAFVRWHGVPALVDPDIYHFFLTPDGKGLWTIDDMKAGVVPLTTADTGELGRYYVFHDVRMRQLPSMAVNPPHVGRYPSGAPSQ